jgi:hypothetical protein
MRKMEGSVLESLMVGEMRWVRLCGAKRREKGERRERWMSKQVEEVAGPMMKVIRVWVLGLGWLEMKRVGIE